MNGLQTVVRLAVLLLSLLGSIGCYANGQERFVLGAGKVASAAHPISQARISWIPGKDLVACFASEVDFRQTCKVVRQRVNSQDLGRVVTGDFVPGQPASWIEEDDSGYSLCVLSSRTETVCERLSMPRVGGARLVYANDSLSPPKLTIAFPKANGVASESALARQTIGKQFVVSYLESRNRVIATLSSRSVVAARAVETGASAAFASPQRGMHLNNEPPPFLVATGYGCDPLGGDCTGGGGGPGLDGFDPDVITGNPGGNYGAAANPACVARCTTSYESASMVCRGIPSPQVRAICWAGAASVYGGCLASC